jgi:hypothetical protein
MKKIVLGMCLLSAVAFGQDYKTGIGLKGGFPGFGALNVKHFVGEKAALDISVGGNNNYLWLQGLYEIHNPLVSGINWYYGGGADLGLWSGNNFYTHKGNVYNQRAWGGIDGVLGAEYTFSEVPFSISAEFVPSVRLFPYVGFWTGGAVALRYTIK